ncbi:hypothetical protein J3E72DRAFT_340908, partial [Bipolaris maydis]
MRSAVFLLALIAPSLGMVVQQQQQHSCTKSKQPAVTHPALTAAPRQTSPAVVANGRCGPAFGGKTCTGSRAGKCCSKSSYCGSTSDHCAADQCLKGYGKCDEPVGAGYGRVSRSSPPVSPTTIQSSCTGSSTKTSVRPSSSAPVVTSKNVKSSCTGSSTKLSVTLSSSAVVITPTPVILVSTSSSALYSVIVEVKSSSIEFQPSSVQVLPSSFVEALSSSLV